MSTHRRKNEPGGRPFVHQVKLSAQEELALQQKAQALDISLVRYLVESGLGKNQHMQRKIVATELFGARRDLTGVATNLNQLARFANSGNDPQGEIEEVLVEIKGTVQKINEALVGLW